MIANVLTLINTLLQIVLLRQGPAALPRAPIITVAIVALWLFVGVGVLVAVDSYSLRKFAIDLFLTAIGLVVYALVINAADKAARIRQALGAILGCGALLGLVLLFAELLLPRFLAVEQMQSIITVIWLWSLPVEAHIIARAIDRQWYVGFVAALMVLILQLFLLTSLSSVIDPQVQQQSEMLTTEPV